MNRPSWTHLLIHHSAGHDTPGLELAEIRRYHMDVRSWSDIGYHAITEEIDGVAATIFARPWWRPGSHCPQQGMNRRALGHCIVGNFSAAPPSRELLTAAAVGTASMCYLGRIPLENVQRHRDYKATECPGDLFPWSEFVELVAERLR